MSKSSKKENKTSKYNQEKTIDALDRELEDLRAPVAKKSRTIFEDDESTDFSKLKKSDLIERLESYRRHEASATESESSEEDKKKPKKSSTKKTLSTVTPKKNLVVDECDAIAIVYSIESDKHPFHHLNGQFDSVELEKIFDITKEEVEKGKTIEFLKSVGDEHQLVSAIISSDKVFKIPKKKAGKFVIGSSDMTNNFQAQKKSAACSSEEANSDKLAVAMVKILEAASKNTPNNEIVLTSGIDEKKVEKSENDDEELSGQDVTISIYIFKIYIIL
jgi:hypothetical protein